MNGLNRILQSLKNGSHSLKSIIFATTVCKAEIRGTFIATLRGTLTDCSIRGINTTEWGSTKLSRMNPPSRPLNGHITQRRAMTTSYTLEAPGDSLASNSRDIRRSASAPTPPKYDLTATIWHSKLSVSIFLHQSRMCALCLSKKPTWRSQSN